MKLSNLLKVRTLRVHGNGFMQLDVDNKRRLHFWCHPGIPRQAVASPIHDHIFGFDSVVIKGSIINIRLQAKDADAAVAQYKIHKVEDANLVPTGECCDLYPTSTDICHQGDTYKMLPGQLHDTMVYVPTVTMIYKDTSFLGSSEGARVMVPYDKLPDNEFKRDAFDQDTLQSIVWDIVGDNIDIGG